ncbi:MAG: radical SAM-associated putative lipoprotein [Bacteroidaceae bacterium]|nr:radical SAM-associated putative lipoprotein [Bacteroidaceae bacterium]
MNKKKRWNVESLLSGALALLGFAGCTNINDAPDLYGTPSVDYKVIGTVTDEQGKPLKDIQVIVKNPNGWSYYDDNTSRESLPPQVIPDTLYTDKDGKFTSNNVHAISVSKFTVEIQDIDGEANGGEFLQKQFTKNDFNEKRIKKGKGFYNGEYEYSKTVQLKRKDK